MAKYVLWPGKRLINTSISHCQCPVLLHSTILILDRGSGDREMGMTGKSKVPWPREEGVCSILVELIA